MIHNYYTIRDKVAKKFVHVCESENDQTMARMCNILERDEKSFIGQSAGDYVAYLCAKFNDETGGAKNSYHMKGMAADIVVKKQ